MIKYPESFDTGYYFVYEEYDVQGEGSYMSRNRNTRFVTACGSGVLVMLCLTTLWILLLPIFILNEYFPIEYTRVFIIILMGITAASGSLVAGKQMDQGEWFGMLLPIGIYDILLLFGSIFFFDGITSYFIYGMIGGFAGVLVVWLLLNEAGNTRGTRKRGRHRG